MLVAGDFNSVPGSPAHALLTKGKVDGVAVESIDPLRFLRDQKLSHTVSACLLAESRFLLLTHL